MLLDNFVLDTVGIAQLGGRGEHAVLQLQHFLQRVVQKGCRESDAVFGAVLKAHLQFAGGFLFVLGAHLLKVRGLGFAGGGSVVGGGKVSVSVSVCFAASQPEGCRVGMRWCSVWSYLSTNVMPSAISATRFAILVAMIEYAEPPPSALPPATEAALLVTGAARLLLLLLLLLPPRGGARAAGLRAGALAAGFLAVPLVCGAIVVWRFWERRVCDEVLGKDLELRRPRGYVRGALGWAVGAYIAVDVWRLLELWACDESGDVAGGIEGYEVCGICGKNQCQSETSDSETTNTVSLIGEGAGHDLVLELGGCCRELHK